jgi:hypothetical protein
VREVRRPSGSCSKAVACPLAVGEGDGDETVAARVEEVIGEQPAGAGLLPIEAQVAVFLGAEVFEAERPTQPEVAQALGAAVVGAEVAGLAAVRKERREPEQQKEQRPRHAPRMDGTSADDKNRTRQSRRRWRGSLGSHGHLAGGHKASRDVAAHPARTRMCPRLTWTRRGRTLAGQALLHVGVKPRGAAPLYGMAGR